MFSKPRKIYRIFRLLIPPSYVVG